MNRNILLIVIVGVSLIAIPSIYYFVYLPSIPKNINIMYLVVRTPAEMVQSVIAGEADFCLAIGDPLVAHLQGSTNLKCVLATIRTPFVLVARPGITSFDEVKTFSVPGQADVGYLLTMEYAKLKGLEPDVDISARFVGWPGLLPSVLEGQVDATTLGTSASIVVQNGGKILWSYAEEFPDYLVIGVTTTDEVITQKPETVKAVVKAIYRSQVYLMSHKTEAIDYAVNELGLDQNYANFIYEFGYEGILVKNMRLNPPGLPIDALNYTMRLHADFLGKEEIPLDQWVDFTFLQQVEDELGTN
jgi:ABC-type nitrate/sulfonate/bicarbonate transport system substrate-binding protein